MATLNPAAALRHFNRFEEALTVELLEAPFRYAYFKETGAPYRAKLFQLRDKTFWIIYSVDGFIITRHRFWDCARKPGTHALTI